MTGERLTLPVATGRETARAVLELVRPHRLLAAGTLLVLLARAAAGLASPYLLGSIVDLVVGGRPAADMVGPFLLLLAAAVVEGTLTAAGTSLVPRFGEPVLASLREQVFSRALGLPLSDVERAGTGDLVARVGDDVAAVSDAIREAVPALVWAGLGIGLTIVGLGALDWRLALAGLCAVPIQAWTVRWFLPRSGPMYALQRRVTGERAQQLYDSIDGAATVRAFRLNRQHAGLVTARSKELREVNIATARLQTRFFGRLNLAEFVGLSAILLTGFYLVDSRQLTIGAVTTAALYFQKLFDPINVLLYLIDRVQSAGAALARLVGVYRMPGPAGEGSEGAGRIGASVEVSDLNFAYDSGPPVLKGICLSIGDGERVALVGVSGAGKTTLAKLIAGVHQPGSGELRVGGRTLAELGPDGVREAVCLITQEVHVFAGPLREDLRLARPGATDAEIEAALELVGAAAWAAGLPEGLATVVGEGGTRLSATQAQQLALARLALRDPAVAVLDEATAEAGSAGARLLERAADAVLEGRSSLVVAHRLTQAAAADRVVVMDQGLIVEEGRHADLLAGDGVYARLWRAWSAARVPGA